MTHQKSRAGFTLVELAIVLVIIGLIIGSVLVGEDLINAATIRAQVSDMEKYNAAVNTFRGKYGGIPGDLLNSKALAFGFNTALNDASRDGSAGKGDGNGIIDSSPVGFPQLGQELVLFWVDLGNAGLINWKSSLTSITATSQANMTNDTLASNNILPKSHLRPTTLLVVLGTSHDGHNYYALGTIATSTGGWITMTSGVTPLEARGIDDKLDDGLPMSGMITAIAGGPYTADTPAAAGPCSLNSTPPSYISDTDIHLNALGCSLSFRAPF